ncbi:hypothetical protein GCM10010406_26450 [Streptomyces thermolineatus]|uniref:Uncharacterized protein n=1 Tax=Streptomyces thermolineatus TaxID=44033 RepID=A0ABN3LRG2_9ACTN
MVKAHQLLRAMPNTAVDDGTARRTPCRFKSAGRYDVPGHPVLTASEVCTVADASADRLGETIRKGRNGKGPEASSGR